jgi:very-short-patch-repair endonuclease
MRNESALDHEIDGQRSARSFDALIAALADRQHGVVSRGQLTRLGLGRGAIDHRLECGRLHFVHRGVYAVGHRVLSKEARWLAAVLAAGRGAVLSHRSAAALWGIRHTTSGIVDVTASHTLRPRAGFRPHRAHPPEDEVTEHDGIPTTTPPRTLLDLAAVLPARHLERAINEAEYRRLTDPLSLSALVARHPRRRGVRTIRKLLEAGAIGHTLTRSDLEDRFLQIVDAADLPRPRINTPITLNGDTIEPDCTWPHHHLIVELDGYAGHGTRHAFEKDRARDRRLQAAGWRVVRITWRQLHDDPDAIADEIRAMLEQKYPSDRR